MARMILRKTGVVLLTILKGLLHAIDDFKTVIRGVVKLFLLLFALIARVVLSFVGIASSD